MWFSELFRPIQRRIRMYFRQRMLPMSADEAEDKREFLSKLYLLCTFTGFSVFMYSMCKKSLNLGETVNPEDVIEKFKVEGNIRIIKFDGFNKVEDYYYNKESKKTNAESFSENTPVQEF